MLWLICGACKGVGKTFFAKRLCSVLPDCIYAKLGHGKAVKGKSKNFFTSRHSLAGFIDRNVEVHEHLVVESHAIDTPGRDAVTILIETGTPTSELRDDLEHLRQRCDIRIAADTGRRDWRKALSHAVRDQNLLETVLDLLAEQKRWVTRGRLSVRSKVWLINLDGEHVFGSGLAARLEDIQHLGSLKAAAERAGRSYRHVWGEINRAERHLGLKLLERCAGGAGGGGSCLTDDGREVLALFRRLNHKVAESADREFAKLTVRKELEQR